MADKKHVTIRDIARATGVHPSTVSLALRGNLRISAAVRSRVQTTADEMGYRPDPMLSALAQYRRGQAKEKISSSLAWINAWKKPEKLRELLEFDGYWEGSLSRASDLGYHLEEFRFGHGITPIRLHQILQARNVRGIILPPHITQPDWQDFPWQHYSLVRYGRSLSDPRCHLVIPAHITNTYLAFQNILAKGYGRIGYVGFSQELRERRILFEVGFLAAQEIYSVSCKIPPFLFPDYDTSKGREIFLAWLEEHKPDAIYTTIPGLQKILEEGGLSVPGDIGLVGTTVLDTPIPAGINQKPDELGRVSVSILHSLILRSQFGIPESPTQTLVEGVWQDGASLPSKIPPKESGFVV